jgi:hypothetical protein
MEYVWKQKPKASQAAIEKLGKEINVNPYFGQYADQSRGGKF